MNYNNKSGFVQVYRSIIDWEWYTEENVFKVYMHCMLKANYSTKKWQGIVINKNEFITSQEKIAIETGLTTSKVRTALKKLQSTNEIEVTTTAKYSLIKVNFTGVTDSTNLFVDTVFNEQHHNLSNKQNSKQYDEQLATGSQSINNQIATTNNKQEEDIKTRKKIFREKVFKHSKFNNNILNSFFDYWSELDFNSNKMRFECERFFEIDKRLNKWRSNEKKFTTKESNKLSINR